MAPGDVTITTHSSVSVCPPPVSRGADLLNVHVGTGGACESSTSASTELLTSSVSPVVVSARGLIDTVITG